MPEFYLIKNFITLNFGGNNKSTVVIGSDNEGVIANSRLLKKTVNLPKNRHPEQLKSHPKA